MRSSLRGGLDQALALFFHPVLLDFRPLRFSLFPKRILTGFFILGALLHV